MDTVDEVRRALRPLISRGLVHDVVPGPFVRYEGGLTPSQPPLIKVLVNADDPEEHRAAITKLVRQAGWGVDLSLFPNPLRPQS